MYWQSRGYQFLWVMLSTANGGNGSKLAYDHKRLRLSLDRRFGFGGVEFFQVQTTEGNGVLHVIWAWKGQRSFYVPQEWLSREWNRIHGAPVVWVGRVGNSQRDRDRVSRYVVAQYCGGQSGFVRFSYSWWRSEFPIGKCWEALKSLASVSFRDDTAKWGWRREFVRPMAEVVASWQALLTSGEALLGETLLRISGRELVEVF